MAQINKLSAIFFGTDEFAKNILEQLFGKGELNFQAIVTQPDKPFGRKKIINPPPVKILAQEKKIPIWQPSELKTDFINQLIKITTDIFIVAAYGKILPPELINLPKYKTINLHPSLLPKYRGPSPIQAALLNNDRITGSSLILIDKKMDRGPIISQQPMTVKRQDNYISLSKKLACLSAELLTKTLAGYVSGKIKPQTQNHHQATYTKIIKKENGLINSDKTAEQIYNMWRAYIVWPGVFGHLNIKAKSINIKLLDIELTALSRPKQSSLELFTQNNELYLACAKGTCLKINQLQPQGKKIMPAKSFINGYLK